MNVLILAAGYATRLYPLTLNKAKPLLDVAGKPMVEWVVENLRGVAEIETIYIVTNAKFFADFEAIKKYGVVTVDADGVITHFEEKPKEPKSSLAAIALYFYSKDVLPLFTTYIAAGNNPDQPGLFLQWLYPRKPVNTFQITG